MASDGSHVVGRPNAAPLAPPWLGGWDPLGFLRSRSRQPIIRLVSIFPTSTFNSRPSVCSRARESRSQGSRAELLHRLRLSVDRRRAKRSPLTCIVSEMNNSSAAALVGNPEPRDQSEDNAMPSAQLQEEAIKKKFGGLMPKKPPLISKDHERAYFDSADWALGKQGVAKPKGPLEALRPKLQPTRQQQQQRSRRPIYTASENEDGEAGAAEDMNMN